MEDKHEQERKHNMKNFRKQFYLKMAVVGILGLLVYYFDMW